MTLSSIGDGSPGLADWGPAAEWAHCLPSDAEVAAFQRDGYYLSRPIFSADDLARAVAAQDAFYRGERQGLLPNGEAFPDQPFGAAMRKSDYAGFVLDDIRRLEQHPAIAAIAARLIGAESIRLWHDQLLYKAPAGSTGDGQDRVGWHTDRGYWKTCTSAQMLTAWIPFQAMDATYGPLGVVPGSHRWGGDDDETFAGDFFTNDSAEQWRQIRSRVDGAEQLTLTFATGQVSFHHCRLIHGSAPNRADAPRRSLAVHLQPGDNRWRRRVRADGSVIHHGTDHLCGKTADGTPDYADPAWFPTLYPRAE